MFYIWKAPKVFCETDENGKKKYGFTNQNGKVVPAIFDSIGTFVAGYATATKDGERFTIDSEGERRKASH